MQSTDIGKQKNREGSYIRCLLAGLLGHLDGKITWVNHFTDEDREVVVPFHYAYGGNERFMLDATKDDIVGFRLEGTNDEIPRGAVTFTSWSTVSGDTPNPNVSYEVLKQNGRNMERWFAPIKWLPIKVTADIKILVASEGDLFECWSSTMESLWFYKYFHYTYRNLKLDAQYTISENVENSVVRDNSLESDTTIIFPLTLEIKTLYPVINWEKATPGFGVNWKQNIHMK
jgi:hypothetical protein